MKYPFIKILIIIYITVSVKAIILLNHTECDGTKMNWKDNLTDICYEIQINKSEKSFDNLNIHERSLINYLEYILKIKNKNILKYCDNIKNLSLEWNYSRLVLDLNGEERIYKYNYMGTVIDIISKEVNNNTNYINKKRSLYRDSDGSMFQSQETHSSWGGFLVGLSNSFDQTTFWLQMYNLWSNSAVGTTVNSLSATYKSTSSSAQIEFYSLQENYLGWPLRSDVFKSLWSNDWFWFSNNNQRGWQVFSWNDVEICDNNCPVRTIGSLYCKRHIYGEL